MKTKNVFTLTATTVTMEVFDLTGFNKGDDTSKAPKLAEQVFNVEDIPALLDDGEQAQKSLAAYGLSRLMQDRASDFTDGKLAEECSTTLEIAEMRVAAYAATYDVLKSGQFRARRESKGKQAQVDTYFAQALCDFLGEQGKEMDVTTATAWLQGQDAEARKALRSKLATHIQAAKAKAQSALDGMDMDSLLG